jgi:hypothetical protein
MSGRRSCVSASPVGVTKTRGHISLITFPDGGVSITAYESYPMVAVDLVLADHERVALIRALGGTP